MAILSFKVQADYEKVVRLREEIARLETQMKKFGRNTPIAEIKAVEKQLATAKKEFNAVATEAAEAGAQMSNTFKEMAKGAASVFSIKMAGDFAAQVAQVRGEFQQLEIAFETMLQSKDKADALMAQIVDTAAKTPFDLQGVANGAKQLLAYGVASEQVNDTLVRLGDIASGLSIPLGDLVYLYGTTMAQGRMFTMDLRQFQGRGIPMTEELAKVMGVTKNEVAGLVTAGKIGFKEMEQAIKNMTNEGGKFANLMEKQSKTITGQMSNLEDSIAQMFNEIGKSSEGAISSAIGVVSNLVENYKEVGEIIGKIVLVAGTYKAALVTMNAVNMAAMKAEKAMLLELLAVKGQENAADNVNIATTGRSIATNNAEIVSLRQEVAARLDALKTTLLAAKGEEAAARTTVERLTVQLSLSKLRVKQAKEELAVATASGNADAIAAAKANLATAAKERNTLSRELNIATTAHETAVTNAETAASAVNTMQTNIETAAIDNQTKSTLLLTAAKKKLAAIGQSIGKVLANPYVLAAAGVAALAGSVIGLIDSLNVEDEAHKNVTEAIKKHNEALDEMKSKAESLISTITDEARTNMERARAIEELRSLYPDLFRDMSDAEMLTMKQMDANKKLAEETERLREEELRLSLQRKREALSEQEGTHIVQGANGASYSVNTSDSVQARRLRKEIELLEAELKEFEELKKKADFNALPPEAKIVSLKEQIATLEKENEELGKQIDETVAKQWTIADLGNLSFDWSATATGEDLLAKLEANRKKAEEMRREVEKLENQNAKQGLTDKQKQAKYNRKKAEEKSAEELMKMEVDLQNKVTQSKIDAMDEGFAKEIAQYELNLKKQKEAYAKEQKDLLKKLQNDEMQKWLAADPENRKEYDFVPTITEDSEEYKKYVAQYAKLAADAVAAYNKSIADAEVEWTFQNKQTRVDSMDEGAAKERAQRNLDNEKELYNLEQQREAYIEAAKAAHILAEKKKMAADPTYMMKMFDEAQANASYDAVVEHARKRQDEELVNDYMSYIDKKKAIDEAYEVDKAQLEDAYNRTGDEKFMRSLDERTKAYKSALSSLEQEFGTDEYKLIFGDPERMTSATIEKALDTARKKLSSLDKEADPETFKALSEAIERLEEARDNNPFQGWDTSVMGLIQKLMQIRNIRRDIAKYEKEGNSEAKENAEGQLERSKLDLKNALIGTGITQFGNAISMAAAGMREVAEASGDIDLERQAKALERAGGVISSVATGAASGGWVGAIVGGATALMDTLIASITESKVVAAEAKKAYEDYIDEIAASKRQINDEYYETIFGVKALDKVRAAASAAQTSLDDYWTAFNQHGTRYSHNKKEWIRPDNLMEQLVWEGKAQTPKNAYNMPTLAEKFPDLFKDGKLQLDQAKIILETYAKYSGEEWYEYLSDATKALEDYETNVKIVDDYIGSLFSSMGDDLASAIMKGDDALEILQDNASNVFASIAQEVIKSAIISQDFIDRYKEKLREALGTEGEEDDAQVLSNLMLELKDGVEKGKEKWEQIKQIAEQYGIDMDLEKSEDAQQQATSKGYQTLSEDTGNELVGRALAQYESNLRMEDAMRLTKESVDIMAANQIQIRDIASEARSLIADSYLELQQIRENTGAVIKPIKEMSAKMVEWDTYIKRL